MLGMIRVLTMQDKVAIDLHGRVIEQHYGLPVTSVCIPDQPKGIYDDITDREAVPKIVLAAQQLVEQGCTSIGISCAADPALEETRQVVSVPVYGAGSCAALLALTSASRVGVLTILEEAPPLIRRILGDSYIGTERPIGVQTTLDLNTPQGKEAAMAAALRLQEKGAEVIVLACTGFVTMNFAPELERTLGIRAIDPIVALGAAVSVR
ncbi:hydantoin racemase [Paenibacillus polymyxa]|uniref:aspartate/glutamate racemase family protein n=1 Tax=Paenibacillus TaxID=44249 RepID=UPI0008FCD7C9|nr:MULTISPECIES: aspartate/glutamate racemase family protein [Paenibacillus]APB71894.1 hydantoin racemase [Paenibacillus polymyxa]OMF44810.1 hydantoin racemase [Paenibacillus peoriae]QYK61184.1 Hydantoin racemase [Paenibacillus sp. S25]